MPLGSLDRTPPSLFKQGPSSLSKFLFFCFLAFFLMVADTRFQIAKTLRSTIATVLHPVSALLSAPVAFLENSSFYFESLSELKASDTAIKQKLLLQTQRASQVEVLSAENAQLRSLLKLKENLTTPSVAAEVLYAAADPYSRKVVVDKGAAHDVVLGSPVIDTTGVLGQVVRVHPLTSEVALLIDREQTTPVFNVRTGARSIVYGNPSLNGDALELRFISGNADVLAGDELHTSGIDGVYPAGLAVAKVAKVERRTDSTFAKITCAPQALIFNVKHVMILKPVTDIIPNKLLEVTPDLKSKRKVIK